LPLPAPPLMTPCGRVALRLSRRHHREAT
jgi:hypothetical protein